MTMNLFLLDEAAVWAARLMSGEASCADYAAYSAWCASSPAHAAAGREALDLWKLAGVALRPASIRVGEARRRPVSTGGENWRDEDWSFLAAQRGPHSHFNFLHWA
jgi:ferric-dicitrate binding protein FerR (iron transport regulator)